MVARQPDLTPEQIRSYLRQGMTPADIARTLTELLGRRVPPETIRVIIHRHRDEWDLGPAQPGRSRLMAYQHREDLGEIGGEHAKSMILDFLSLVERIHAGMDVPPGNQARARAWERGLVLRALVVDYSPPEGVYKRSAYPWELGCLWRQQVPPRAAVILAAWIAQGVRDVEVRDGLAARITQDHLDLWRSWRI